MRLLKIAALAAALVGGALSATAPASAAPVSAGAGLAIKAPLVEQVQYWGGGPVYGYGGGRRYYGGDGPRWRGGPRYRGGGRVVCRTRYTPYGPRRDCFRRW